MTLRKFAGLGALLSIVMPSLAMAADEVAAPVLNSGDTAWMLTSTALVLFMTIPAWRCSMAVWFAPKTFFR